MNLVAIRKIVEGMVPGLTDVSLQATGDGTSGCYFICKRGGKMRCVFAARTTGVWIAARTDAQMASEIARELRA